MFYVYSLYKKLKKHQNPFLNLKHKLLMDYILVNSINFLKNILYLIIVIIFIILSGVLKKEKNELLYIVVRWEVYVKVISIKNIKILIGKLSNNKLMRILLLDNNYRNSPKLNRVKELNIL